MEKQEQKQKGKKHEKKDFKILRKEVLSPEQVSVGLITLTSNYYSCSQLLSLVDLCLKKKSIREYLLKIEKEKMISESRGYIG